MEHQQNADLKQYIAAFIKWWWLIVVSVVVAGLVSYLAAQSQPKQYFSSATLLVGQGTRSVNANASDLSISQALAQSYADIATREPVMLGTLNALQLPWDADVLRNKVSARVVQGTQLLEVSVIDTDPQRAKVLADTVANQLIQQSPSAGNLSLEDKQLVQEQVADIRDNLRRGKEDLKLIDETINKAQSAQEIRAAQSRQSVLQQQMTRWQGTLGDLLLQLQSGAANSLSVIEPAKVPSFPIGPNLLQNVILAVAIAFALSAGAALVLEFLDDTVKCADDVRHVLGLTPMGSIARIETGDLPSDKLVVSRYPMSPAAESYRVLRTNLQFKMGDKRIRTLMVTSTVPMEGKSLTSANLATVLAHSGKRVLLVDADLRRPTVHRIFEVGNSAGLTTALASSTTDYDEFIHEEVLENLSVMTSGPLPPNPAELLSSARMYEIVRVLSQRFDVVIFDTPPVMAVADATVLASAVDGALLVVDNNHTRKKLLRQSFDALLAVGTNVMGVVLNRVSIRGNESSYTYYYPQRNEVSGKSRRRDRKPARIGSPVGRLQSGMAVDSADLPQMRSYSNNGHTNGAANGGMGNGSANGQNGKDSNNKINRQIG